MREILKKLLLSASVVGFGAIFFCGGYAIADWTLHGRAEIFSLLNSSPAEFIARVRLDFAAGDVTRLPGAALAAVLGMTIPLVASRLSRPNKSNDSRFMSMADVRKSGLTAKRGVFIGRAGGRLVQVLRPQTNARNGKFTWRVPRLRGGKKLWVSGDDVGGFVIGPPRSGKGASIIIPNALSWPHSLVVLDLRGETYDATAGYRSSMSKVVRFAPADRNGNTEFYNPMDFISLDSSQRDIDLRNMAAALFPKPPGNSDPYWVMDARTLFIGIASYVMETTSLRDDQRTFATILRILGSVDEPITEFLAGLRDRNDASYFTLNTLLPFVDMSEKQFSGVYSGVRTGMAPFLNERLIHATSKSSFDIRKLKRERISLYLDVRREQISSLGPLFNVLITQMMNFMSESIPQPGEHQVLVMLDEFQNLGRLENVTEMATLLGGNGVPMWFFVQSLKAVDEIYREEGRKTLINAARVQVFFGAQDTDDLKYVSDQLGETSELKTDVTRTQNTLFDASRSRSVHTKEVRRPLMRADEIRTMDKSKVIILTRGEQPILGTRNFYYADKELAKRAFLPIPGKATSAEDHQPKAPKASTSSQNSTLTSSRPYRSGMSAADERLQPGATFRKKAGFVAPKTADVAPSDQGTDSLSGNVQGQTPPTQQKKKVDFAAMAGAAKKIKMPSEKEAQITELLQRGKSFRSKSSDPEIFDQEMAIVEEALTDIG
ncbi:type IV secretory system conjugative DNA transfer family protein [Agrobacterium tumefaciens]|uniref:type IV secretory system conjugative DNA transfer family protein n=1 Tax=Agrobacterium tumefaciens TaxID=358 RepID=UPI001574042C|nr:type IV secretory system conjugative DNA transfer family protein [Agrobacterium tumefaciens]NTE53179.1 type IV secretory system conjugative DNA transfer family protein [Agrobacterium tumefaciens]